MEFCGRCGNELGRGLEQGRFCAACGHESPGNARYPLYAEGSGAGAPGGTAVAERPTEPATDTATQVAELRRIVQPPAPPASPGSPAAVTTAPAATYASDEGPTAWRTALVAGLVAMLAVVLLGLFLMLR